VKIAFIITHKEISSSFVWNSQGAIFVHCLSEALNQDKRAFVMGTVALDRVGSLVGSRSKCSPNFRVYIHVHTFCFGVLSISSAKTR